MSGVRVSNTWVICLALGDNLGKLGLIPDGHMASHGGVWKAFNVVQGVPAAYQLVGGVRAYQGDDG